MYNGVAYERYVRSRENLLHPNCLTRSNFSNARKVSSQGWSYAAVEPLIDRTLPSLERIPLDADLFLSDACDIDAIDALDTVFGHPGIRVANATKLLYQKRYKLIPILDVYVRQALDVPYYRETYTGRRAFELGFRKFREVANYAHNDRALSAIESYLKGHPEITGGMDLSRLRIIDILAWGAIQRMQSQAVCSGCRD
jgi:hypothetical protein